MRPAVQHDAPGGYAHSRDYIILLLELTIEGILGAVDIEGRRQIALGQPACIHISHAEAAIDRRNRSCLRRRHTFATMALQNGVDVKTVSSMLGHYSAGFTLDTYAHVTTDAQLKAAQTMGNILSRAV